MNSFFKIGSAENLIMVVEDSSVQAKKLKFLLEENNFRVVIQNNGMDALVEIRKDLPILIISDIVMPEMDGYGFCSKIKEDPLLKEIPVILLTSLRDPIDIIKGLQSGADNFITKPYEENYLLSRIQYLLVNKNLRKSGSAEMVIEIMFRGNKYSINSDKKQILDLLLSVYEAAILRNDELIQTQAKLQTSNEELMIANEALDSFTHTVTHDLRSPLHQISGYAQILQEELSASLDDEKMGFLDKIEQSAFAMATLIEDLMNFARSGRAPLEPQKIDLTQLCKEIVENLRNSNPRRKVNFSIQQGLSTNADPSLIRSVMENLLGNAWKYTNNNAEAEIVLKQTDERGRKIFSLSDNGAGFDSSKSQKLFNAFERLHTQQEFPGTGVGLATVKRIIERHGGSIWAEGSVGRGATFYWTLP
jgi:two-component system sensor histidine kinase/response regulator